jgi:hypothetical protein
MKKWSFLSHVSYVFKNLLTLVIEEAVEEAVEEEQKQEDKEEEDIHEQMIISKSRKLRFKKN